MAPAHIHLELILSQVEHNPSDASLRFDEGQAREQMGDFGGACEAYRAAVQLKPCYTKAATALEKALAAAASDGAKVERPPFADPAPARTRFEVGVRVSLLSLGNGSC